MSINHSTSAPLFARTSCNVTPGRTQAKLSRQSAGSPDLSPRVSASFAGMPMVARDEATDASLVVRQCLTSSMTSLISGPHSEMVTRKLAHATCPPIPARTSPSFCWKRKVSTKALLRLSACTLARSPLFVSIPSLVASGTALTLLPSCLGAAVSLPQVFSSGLALSEGPQVSCC